MPLVDGDPHAQSTRCILYPKPLMPLVDGDPYAHSTFCIPSPKPLISCGSLSNKTIDTSVDPAASRLYRACPLKTVKNIHQYCPCIDFDMYCHCNAMQCNAMRRNACPAASFQSQGFRNMCMKHAF